MQDDPHMQFEQALIALQHGHQVYREGQPFFYVASVGEPLRYYRLSPDSAECWQPTPEDFAAADYLIVNPRIQLKNAKSQLDMVAAIKAMRAHNAVQRGNNPILLIRENELMSLKSTEAPAEPYSLTPEDLAARDYEIVQILNL